MKNRFHSVFLLSAFAVMLAFVSITGAQPLKSGSYKVIDKSDAGAGLAADFAVKDQSKKTNTAIALGEIVKAEDQEFKNFNRNFRLCLSVTANGKQSSAQAIVSMDQYSNLKLVSWTNSNCGSSDGFKPIVNDDDAGPGLAADFAVKEQSKRTKSQVTLGEIIKAEDREYKDFTRDFRLCLDVTENRKPSFAQVVVSMDQYSNLKLISWTNSDCGADADNFKPIVNDDDAGPDLAADFAVMEQSKRTKSQVALVEIVKAEDREFKDFSRNFRLCLNVTANKKRSFARVVVSMDQYSNFNLISWSDGKCSK